MLFCCVAQLKTFLCFHILTACFVTFSSEYFPPSLLSLFLCVYSGVNASFNPFIFSILIVQSTNVLFTS